MPMSDGDWWSDIKYGPPKIKSKSNWENSTLLYKSDFHFVVLKLFGVERLFGILSLKFVVCFQSFCKKIYIPGWLFCSYYFLNQLLFCNFGMVSDIVFAPSVIEHFRLCFSNFLFNQTLRDTSHSEGRVLRCFYPSVIHYWQLYSSDIGGGGWV